MAEFGSTVLPLKLFFYMASGRPILAGDTPDIREVLRMGKPPSLPPGLPRFDGRRPQVARPRTPRLAARLAAAAVAEVAISPGTRAPTGSPKSSRTGCTPASATRRLEPRSRAPLAPAVVALAGASRAPALLGAAAGGRLALRGSRSPRCMSGTPDRPGTDAGDGPDRTDSYRRHLGRGFNWLGGATLIARIVDFSTILVVLLYLTKQQVGIGSLWLRSAWSSRRSTGWAPARRWCRREAVAREQLDTLFWFVLGRRRPWSPG